MEPPRHIEQETVPFQSSGSTVVIEPYHHHPLSLTHFPCDALSRFCHTKTRTTINGVFRTPKWKKCWSALGLALRRNAFHLMNAFDQVKKIDTIVASIPSDEIRLTHVTSIRCGYKPILLPLGLTKAVKTLSKQGQY